MLQFQSHSRCRSCHKIASHSAGATLRTRDMQMFWSRCLFLLSPTSSVMITTGEDALSEAAWCAPARKEERLARWVFIYIAETLSDHSNSGWFWRTALLPLARRLIPSSRHLLVRPLRNWSHQTSSFHESLQLPRMDWIDLVAIRRFCLVKFLKFCFLFSKVQIHFDFLYSRLTTALHTLLFLPHINNIHWSISWKS